MIKPVRQYVKLEIRSSKLKSGIIIQSEQKEYNEAFVADMGELAKEQLPMLKEGMQVELLGSLQLRMFKEDNKMFALVDSMAIIGYYEC